MFKKIRVNQLDLGMYIHYLNCDWMEHPFLRNRFLVDDVATLEKIKQLGVTHVYIDTSRGADVKVPASIPVLSEQQVCELSPFKPDTYFPQPPGGEFVRAKDVYASSNKLMHDVLNGVRRGWPLPLKQCEEQVDKIIEVMFSSPSTFLAMTQMKTREEYTAQHSVSVAALAVAFGRVLDLPREEIRAVALGGLLHDIGKATVPKSILNKRGRLSSEEFHVMKGYVLNTARLLTDTHGVSDITLNAAVQHSERYGGTGYPRRLKGEQISLHGQMLAIVDFYDAITSVSAYHKGMPPTTALKKLFKLSGTHFNPRLVQAFIKGIGIYPAGSLVRLESERLGIVKDVPPDRMLQPVIQLIYDCKKMCYIPPETVDMATSNDRIKSNESYEEWGIDQARWVAGGSRKRFRAVSSSPG